MHHCLNIVEVQRTVFKDVYDEPGGRTALARLARTCRAFNNTALDVLWANLDSFLSLIYALPRDLWKVDRTRKQLVFRRPMSLKDWKIFSGYSSRVRSLSYRDINTQARCTSLDEDVILALSTPPSHGPLLPHLKVLRWKALDSRQNVSLLRFLLSPSLDSISLISCTLRSHEIAILNSIGTICPSLKCLRITPDDILGTNGEEILSDALLRLQSLETLRCPVRSKAAIVRLSHLPSLANLSLSLQPDFPAEKVQPSLEPPAFASMQSLALHANTLSILTSSLEHIHFKPRSASFVVEESPTLDALDRFFLTLAGSCDPEQLSSVSLDISRNELPLDALRVTLSTFQPLLAFPNIDSFKLNLSCEIALDDDAIDTLVNQWPKLTELSINARTGWGIVSRITPKGLIRLLSGCTELIHIALSVDFSDIDKPYVPLSHPGNGITGNKHIFANFVTSILIYPATVAAFLSGICPQLGEVKSSWCPHSVRQGLDTDVVKLYRERWEQVGKLLPAFSAVRKQGMALAQK